MELVNGQGKNHGGQVWVAAVRKLLCCRVKYILLDPSCEAFSAMASAS